MEKRLGIAFYLGWWLLTALVVFGGVYLLLDIKPNLLNVTCWLVGSLIGHLIARYVHRPQS